MKIICVGRNYKNHIKELNSDFPDKPVFFLKPESAVLRNNVFFLPEFSNNVHHEIEIVIRINRLGRHIQSQFADRYYDAVGVGMDLTARDLQQDCKDQGLPWEISKAFDGSAVLSEFVNLDNISDLNNLNFSLHKNGELVQKGNTANMIFGFNHIIEYVSKFMTLKIGDLIFTGTPEGVGRMESGDEYIAYLEDKEMIRIDVK